MNDQLFLGGVMLSGINWWDRNVTKWDNNSLGNRNGGLKKRKTKKEKKEKKKNWSFADLLRPCHKILIIFDAFLCGSPSLRQTRSFLQSIVIHITPKKNKKKNKICLVLPPHWENGQIVGHLRFWIWIILPRWMDVCCGLPVALSCGSTLLTYSTLHYSTLLYSAVV